MKEALAAIGLCLVGAAIACSKEQDKAPPTTPPPTTTTTPTASITAITATPPTTSASSATSATPSTSSSTSLSTGSTSACMMVNVCACNLGCALIKTNGPAKEGTVAKVEKGALQGETVKVVQVADASGAKVLALTDLKHDFACEAPSAKERALLGYACQSDKSGPVPAKACAKGCD